MCVRRVARWYIFSNQNPNLGKFWSVLQFKMLVTFMAIRSILQPFRIFYVHFVYFKVIWYIFPVLVCCPKKNLETLNPGKHRKNRVHPTPSRPTYCAGRGTRCDAPWVSSSPSLTRDWWRGALHKWPMSLFPPRLAVRTRRRRRSDAIKAEVDWRMSSIVMWPSPKFPAKIEVLGSNLVCTISSQLLN
jgi:hypothetical protein